MDNYPPGAAHDPCAPYNEYDGEEIEVTVRQTLVRYGETSGCRPDRVIADGRRVVRLLKRHLLKQHQSPRYAKVWLDTLADDCTDWQEDPEGPYREARSADGELRASQTLVKETVVTGDPPHVCCDWDYDPYLGRRVPTGYLEQSCDVRECFADQSRTAEQCLTEILKIAKQLTADLRALDRPLDNIAGFLQQLQRDCDGWEDEDGFDVE